MKNLAILVLAVIFVQSANAELGLELTYENSIFWESRNVARIPNATGTLLDLNQNRKQPFTWNAPRIYASAYIAKNHEMRALWAPLSISGTLNRPESSIFFGETFAPNQDLQTFYKFNSYRLSYIYHFYRSEPWSMAVGLTAKIRDAEIRISHDNQIASKKNVGFVPLLHFQANRTLGENWILGFDLDASAAPQGRAIDAALKLERLFTFFGAGHPFSLYTGYRTVEGGADVESVYNFAWFNSLIFGARGMF